MTTITPEQAEALCEFLIGPEGCNFLQRDPDDINTASWQCDNTLAKTNQWLHVHGLSENTLPWHACCDCEVVFNAPAGFGEEERAN